MHANKTKVYMRTFCARLRLKKRWKRCFNKGWFLPKALCSIFRVTNYFRVVINTLNSILHLVILMLPKTKTPVSSYIITLKTSMEWVYLDLPQWIIMLSGFLFALEHSSRYYGRKSPNWLLRPSHPFRLPRPWKFVWAFDGVSYGTIS